MSSQNEELDDAFLYDFYIHVGRYIKKYCNNTDKIFAMKKYAEDTQNNKFQKIMRNLESLCDKGYMDDCEAVYQAYQQQRNKHQNNMSIMVETNPPPPV